MTDRFVTVPDSLELPAAVKVPVARLVGPTGAAATPADLGAATAEQGEKADASDVAALTLMAPLALTVPAGFPAGQVYRVVLTQDGTGGHTVTYDGSPVTVDTTAGASTLVELWPDGSIVYPEMATAAPGRWEASAHGVAYDGTDQTAEFRALLDTVAAAGGGVIELGGLVRIDGQIVMPSTVVGTQVRQAPIRITGTVANMPGSTFSGTSTWAGSAGLDLRYAGRADAGCATTLGSAVILNAAAVAGDRGNIVTGAGIPDQAWILAVEPGVSWTLSRAARATASVALTSFGGRLQTLGYGTLELDHLQIVSGAATSAPFVLSTATTLKAHDNLFYGWSGKNGVTCDEDPLILGGPGQGSALTSALTSGVAYTALDVDPIPVGVDSGRAVVINYGCAATQTVTTTAAILPGATSIPVASFTANANYPARTSLYIGGDQKQESAEAWSVPSAPFQGYGTHISDNHFHRCRRISAGGYTTSVWIDNNAWMHNCGSTLAATPSTLTAQVSKGDTVTSLAVTALSRDVVAGDTVQVGGVTGAQTFTASGPAVAGSTSIAVTSATAARTFAVGAKAVNTAAGLGAAIESHALPGSVNTLYIRDNRIGMSGGFTHLTRHVGPSMHSHITGNEWQDSHANNVAAHRFEASAEFNFVVPGMLAVGSWIIDDVVAAGSITAQTLITARQSYAAALPQGLTTTGALCTLKPTTGSSYVYSPQALLTTGELWQWRYQQGSAFLTHQAAGGSGVEAFRVKDDPTGVNTIVTLYGTNYGLIETPNGHARITAKAGYRVNLGDTTSPTSTYVLGGKVYTPSVVLTPTATASRPTPSSAGAGAMIYDSTLSIPVWSDGTNWRNAAGVIA